MLLFGWKTLVPWFYSQFSWYVCVYVEAVFATGIVHGDFSYTGMPVEDSTPPVPENRGN